MQPKILQREIKSRNKSYWFSTITGAAGEINIGSNCLISQYVTIVAYNHNIGNATDIIDQGWNENKKGIITGDDVWVGCE